MEVVSRTISYIFDNLNRDVRLSVAADMIGMSPSAFSRFFKVSSGHTFSDMVRRLRLAHACRLPLARHDHQSCHGRRHRIGLP